MLRRYSGLHLGNLELEDKLVLELDGKLHWFFHGDVFDVSMRGSRWLAKLGTLGYEILILLNKLINFFLVLIGREKTSFSQNVKAATKRGVKKLHDYAVTGAEIGADSGYHVVANGHSHIPEIKEIETEKGKVLYLNSGDWVENMTALEYQNAEWKLVWYKDLTFPETWLKVEEGDLP
jgi:UDP-2,3-diacylglucosamine pyrophosphatase LpxH